MVGCIVLATMLAGCFDDGDDEEQPCASLAMPWIERWDEDNVTVWNVRVDVNRISPEDAEIPWSDLRLGVYDKSGTLILPPQPLREWTDSESSTSPVVWFVETTSYDTNMHPGDGIKLTGIDRTYEGATIELRINGEKCASVPLPKEFP